MSLSQAVERLRLGQAAGDEVVVTFDDGFRNQLDNAAPLLAEHGFSACFFLVTDLLDANADQARALLARQAAPAAARRAARLGRRLAAARARARDRVAHALAPEPDGVAARSPARRAGGLARGALEATRRGPPRQRSVRRPRALLRGRRRRGANRRVRELRVGDPRRQPLRARPLLAPPPSPERVLAASRARVLPARERRRAHAQPARDRVAVPRAASRAGDPRRGASGAATLRRTLRKLRRVGITAAPVGLALRRAYADAGSGPTLDDVATEVVRVPTLNGDEARDALRRLGADVAISLDNAIIRPETFALPAHGDDQRPPRRRARLPRRPAGVLGAPRRARPGRVHDPPDRRGRSTPGPCSRAGTCRSSGARSLAATLAATIPRLHEASLDALEAVLDAAAFDGRASAVGRARTARRRRSATTSTCADRCTTSIEPLFLVKTLFWGALAALAWTHVAYPAAAVAAARLRPRPVRKGDDLPPCHRDRRGARRGRRDRAAAREPARARLPGRQARARRRVRRVDRRDRRARRAASRACA